MAEESEGADGSYRWLSWSVRADAEHQVLYCSVGDVTELREHSDVVTKLLAALERSNTDLEQFAYAASHEPRATAHHAAPT